MKLNLPYLKERHNYWKNKIGEAGIWKPELFAEVTFSVRKHHRRYNAVFHRKIKYKGAEREISDKIVFYNKVDDFDLQFIDNVMVHEMIHQYIIQNEIKDTSAHGRVFKSFMSRINAAFPDELRIRIRDLNPSLPLQGAGSTIHVLLMLHLNDDRCICAVVNPKKTDYFRLQLKRYGKRWGIKSYEWAQSDDVFFSRFTRCTTRLHGLTKTEEELPEFCRQLNIKF